MTDGIIDLVGFAATVALAAPVGLLGALQLADGNLVAGVGFLVIAGGMIALQEWLTTPGDLPGIVVQRVAGRLVDAPEDEE